MKRSLFVLICCVPFLSSCFELREELFIHKEGWGNYKLVVDLSEHREMFQELTAKTDTSTHNPFGKKGASFQELIDAWGLGAERLGQLNGVFNAKEIVDKKNYLIGLRFEFQDISALNLALTLRDGGEFNPSFQLPYSYEKGKLNKNDVFIFQKLLKYLNDSNKEDVRFNNQKKAIFAQISYTTVIKTSGRIKKHNNSHFSMEANQKELSASAPLNEVLSGAVKLNTLVKFK